MTFVGATAVLTLLAAIAAEDASERRLDLAAAAVAGSVLSAWVLSDRSRRNQVVKGSLEGNSALRCGNPGRGVLGRGQVVPPGGSSEVGARSGVGDRRLGAYDVGVGAGRLRRPPSQLAATTPCTVLTPQPRWRAILMISMGGLMESRSSMMRCSIFPVTLEGLVAQLVASAGTAPVVSHARQ
jgi:hypothetical protein